MLVAAAAAEWYQQGNWPLIGAIAVLAVTTIASVGGVLLQAHRTYQIQTKSRVIELQHRRLHEFYDPIYSLLLINARTFAEVGPPSFPEDNERREAAAQVWNRIRAEVIIPNNKSVREILTGKSYLIAKTDDITEYMSLLHHISMYSVFQDTPSEVYSKFQFPKGALRHVEKHREELVMELSSLQGKAK
jgi:hypothetical protein